MDALKRTLPPLSDDPARDALIRAELAFELAWKAIDLAESSSSENDKFRDDLAQLKAKLELTEGDSSIPPRGTQLRLRLSNGTRLVGGPLVLAVFGFFLLLALAIWKIEAIANVVAN